jgi:LysM repeat protein
MGIIQMNRSNKKPKRPEGRAPGLVEEQADIFGRRILSACCMAAAVGSLLLLAFFFSSDVSGNIMTAKATHVYAKTPKVASAEGNRVSDLDSVLSDPDTSREDVAALLNRMSDEDFRAYVERISERAEAGTAETATTGIEGLHESLTKGGLTSKSDILAHLNQMNETEFTVLMKAVTAIIQQDSSEIPLKTALDEAYTKAEAVYPGQIDGSKRLKLIDDLNATDYLYYVAEEGDTLIKLSRSLHVPLGQLVELNGIHDADVIPAGMILLFPSDTKQPDTRE